jgi:hypothetical protein
MCSSLFDSRLYLSLVYVDSDDSEAILTQEEARSPVAATDIQDISSWTAFEKTYKPHGQRNTVLRFPSPARLHLPRLSQSSFFNKSLTEDLIAELRLGYMFALTSSSKPSR